MVTCTFYHFPEIEDLKKAIRPFFLLLRGFSSQVVFSIGSCSGWKQGTKNEAGCQEETRARGNPSWRRETWPGYQGRFITEPL
jgi:hypothetical protein